MPIDIPQAQINFFDEHHFLQLDEYFTPAQVEDIRDTVTSALKKRLGHAPAGFDESYKAGRDLWRDDPKLRKLAFNRDLASIASALTNTPRMRIGCDQALFSHSNAPATLPFVKKPHSISEISSTTPIVCSLVINLSKKAEENFPDTTEPGTLLFVSDSLPIDFHTLTAKSNLCCYLITYVNVKPFYIFNPNDPNTNELKKMGYANGDRLTTETHPFLN